MTIEITSAGPAFCAAAVPSSTKMPVPMIDPMPSAVRFQGPSERRNSPRSASTCNASNDFLVKSPIESYVVSGFSRTSVLDLANVVGRA